MHDDAWDDDDWYDDEPEPEMLVSDAFVHAMRRIARDALDDERFHYHAICLGCSREAWRRN